MLMDILQKPYLRLYFSQNCLVAALLFGSFDSLGQIWKHMQISAFYQKDL